MKSWKLMLCLSSMGIAAVLFNWHMAFWAWTEQYNLLLLGEEARLGPWTIHLAMIFLVLALMLLAWYIAGAFADGVELRTSEVANELREEMLEMTCSRRHIWPQVHNPDGSVNKQAFELATRYYEATGEHPWMFLER